MKTDNRGDLPSAKEALKRSSSNAKGLNEKTIQSQIAHVSLRIQESIRNGYCSCIITKYKREEIKKEVLDFLHEKGYKTQTRTNQLRIVWGEDGPL